MQLNNEHSDFKYLVQWFVNQRMSYSQTMLINIYGIAILQCYSIKVRIFRRIDDSMLTTRITQLDFRNSTSRSKHSTDSLHKRNSSLSFDRPPLSLKSLSLFLVITAVGADFGAGLWEVSTKASSSALKEPSTSSLCFRIGVEKKLNPRRSRSSFSPRALGD